MTTFRVGEVAIMCNAEFDKAANGMECTITATGNRCWSAISGEVYIGYKAVGADGHMRNVAPHQLRKKHPPRSAKAIMRAAILKAKQPCEVPA